MTCAYASGALAQEPLRAEVMHWWTSGGEAAAVKVREASDAIARLVRS